ncbi:MAG: hypothetical protein KBF73_06035 [Flavobacteriales bacterium]|nr:hypothetical protein [Flavobacteriales bacterium]
MKKLIPLILIGFVACNQKSAEPISDSETSIAHTKTMVYAVDLNSVFHEDLNDENFSDIAPLTQQLVSDVLNGKLKAFDPVSEEILTAEQVKSLLQFTDTIWFENEETGDKSIDIMERDYTKDFFGLTFKEQWSYNAEGSIIERKVLGLAPRIPVYSSQGGELRGYTSAFWVKYE